MKSVRFGIAMILILFLLTFFGLITQAYAYTSNPTKKDELVPNVASSGSVSEAHIVKFANKNWHVIGYDGVGVATESGTMTLFYTGSVGRDYFGSGSNVYESSHINSLLGEYVENTGNFSVKEKNAIVARTLPGGASTGNTYCSYVSGPDVSAKLWLLSAAEVQKLSTGIRKYPGDPFDWWLRSPGGSVGNANYVATSEIKNSGMNPGRTNEIRPALLLNLESVTYDAENNKLIAQVSNTHFITVEADTTKGTVTIPARADKGETVSITITPALGYSVGSVKYNGTAITPVNDQYSFTMPDEDVTVSVSYTFEYNVADHIEQNGDVYTIKTEKGWEVFCDCVASDVYSGFWGKTVKLGLDITTGVTTAAGKPGRPFSGTFDGDGNTLAVALSDTANEGTAPFRYVSGATIQNLTVTGTVNGGTCVSGLVGVAWNSTVNNVTVGTAVSGTGIIGGIIGYGSYETVTISNSLFNGSLQTNVSAGGLMGGCDEDSAYKVIIENSLFGGSYTGNGVFHPIVMQSKSYYPVFMKISGAYYTVAPTLAAPDYYEEDFTQVYSSVTEGRINRILKFGEELLYYYPCDVLVKPFLITNAVDPIVPEILINGSVAGEGTYTYKISGVPENQISAPGAYPITITGQGGYCGSCTDTFLVNGDIIYLNENGQAVTRTVGTYKAFHGETSLDEGWWVLAGPADISSRIEISGDVHLVLLNRSVLNAPQGIHVPPDGSLTIYAQSDQEGTMGALTVSSYPEYKAGIGGDSDEDSGTIIINGGNITTIPKQAEWFGAGIGGGYKGSGTIYINGGTINATGAKFAAGIGGGYEGSGTIYINGGTIKATGGEFAAGIGGGNEKGGIVVVNGGTVTATTLGSGTAIGNGFQGNGSRIEIRNGLCLIAGESESEAELAVKEDQASACGNLWARIESCGHKGKVKLTPEKDKLCAYCNTRGSFPSIGAGTENDPWKIGPSFWYTDLPEGWYQVTEDYTFAKRIDVTGHMRLILGEGTTLNAAKGIHVTGENALTISGSGTLNAAAPNAPEDPDKETNWGCAGIGGNIGENGGIVTITGGNVNATGGVWGAAIGGGKKGGNGGTITISGGMVNAGFDGAYNEEAGLAAAIGGGDTGSGGTILITGGTVRAEGRRGSAGIGGGGYGNGGTITITGGFVTAIGASYPNGRSAAGIGAGRVRNNATSGDSGIITITGGTVIAVGGENAQAIGGSNEVAENDSGTLILGDVAVWAGENDEHPVTHKLRKGTCHSGWVKLTTCEEHSIDTGLIIEICRWCGRTEEFIGKGDFVLPGSLKGIAQGAFAGLPMRSVYIPDGCEAVGAGAFAGCAALEQVRIPDSVKLEDIGEDAFPADAELILIGTVGGTAAQLAADPAHPVWVFMEEKKSE